MSVQDNIALRRIKQRRQELDNQSANAEAIAREKQQLAVDEFGIKYEAAERDRQAAFAIDKAVKDILSKGKGIIKVTVEAFEDNPKDSVKNTIELTPELLHEPVNRSYAENTLADYGLMVTGIAGWNARKLESAHGNELIAYRQQKKDKEIAENQKKIADNH